MTADQLIQFLTRSLFVLVFVAVLIETIRYPWRINVDIALLFGAISIVVGANWAFASLRLTPPEPIGAITGGLILAMPYLLLRLVDDFASVPWWVMRAAEAGLVVTVAGLFIFAMPRPAGLTLAQVAYFFTVAVYAAVAFWWHGRRAIGITRRRMLAVATATAALGLAVLLAGARIAAEGAGWEPVSNIALAGSRLLALGSGIGYVVGFAPPVLLRRAWQEPELRAFLARAAQLPRLPDTVSIVRELEHGAAESVGAPNALIVLWDEAAGGLIAPNGRDRNIDLPAAPPGETIAGRVYAEGRAIFTPDAERADPAYRDIYRRVGARALLAAPIIAGEKRLGVLVVYAPRAPIFAHDDLNLLRLLADQAAVILESRALIDEATRLRARDEANRLKDDFLSAAAHDLKTPLTTLVAQAQLLERRAIQRPGDPPDIPGIRRLVVEGRRLKTLVTELLDASRVEQGQLIGHLEPIDLGEVVREACERERSERHGCQFEVDAAVVGLYDRVRILQLLENLIENAVKYSPQGGLIRVHLWREGSVARLTVSDPGIGIQPADLPFIFDRFQRGTNVDDRRFAGMGLGLFICRGIAEQHGGRIWADSTPGQGSTFHVELPIRTGVMVS